MGGATAWPAFLPWLLLGAAGLGGLVSLARLADGQVGGRKDRRAALQLAGGLAIAVGLCILVLVAGMGSPVGGLALLPAGVWLGLVGGVATFLTGIAGYVVLARTRPLGIAFAAEAVTPAAIGLLLLVAMNLRQDAANESNRQETLAFWQRNLDSAMTLSVRNAEASAPSGDAQLRLTLIVDVRRPIAFYADPAPTVRIFPTSSPGEAFEAALPGHVPFTFDEGTSRYDLTAVPVAGAAGTVRPGEWTVQLVIRPGMEGTLTREATFELPTGGG